MRYLAFALMVGGACAQSNYPPCTNSQFKNNCFGEGSYFNETFLGEWVNNQPNGLGRMTSRRFGNRDGLWVGGFLDKALPAWEIENLIVAQKKTDVKNSWENQSDKNELSACVGTFVSAWTNCFGEAQYGSETFIGVWLKGQPTGLGRMTSSRGGTRYGNWAGGFLDKAIPSTEIENWLNITKKSNETTSYAQTQTSQPRVELERLRIENEESKKKQAELESQLRLAQQPVTQQSSPSNIAPRISKRIALVIGNANYNSAPLKNPLNDAADISASLKQSGFEVIDQRNATLQEMTRGIREFGDKLLKSDVGLVYYSGHGLEVKGRNYLLPVNASMIREDEIAFQAIDANLILEKMNTAKKSVNILIVDACRDNPFVRSFRSTNRGLAQMDAPTGTIVSFSTSPGKTASDGDGRNSPFTKNLVKAMMRTDMPIEAMFKEVRKSVVDETKGQQTPWESSSLIGDFYFKVSK